jgi:CHAT domain-containing protein/Tfp pilus assembly protein PilF
LWLVVRDLLFNMPKSRLQHPIIHLSGLLLILSVLLGNLPGLSVVPARIPARQRQQDSTSGVGQEKPVRLPEPGEVVERVLEGEQSHLYEVKLNSGQLLDAVVNQLGIDIVVTVFSPDGQELFQVDSPNGNTGPEPISLIAKATGVYRLEVRALESGAPAGRYEVKINEIRVATAQDQALVESNDLDRESAKLYTERRYDEAIALEERALAIRERLSIPKFPLVVAALTNLANLFDAKRDLTHAIQYAEHALPLVEQALGPEHSEVANRLNNLGVLYQSKRDYVHAEPFFQRALAISEKTDAAEHPDVVVFRLNNLALLLVDKGDYARAEPLYQRALDIAEKLVGKEHLGVAKILTNISQLYTDKGDYARAESVLQRAIAIREKFSGEHPEVAVLLDRLGEVYRLKGEYASAEPLYQRALKILEKTLGPEHGQVATTLNDLALLYMEQSDYARAEPLYQRALAISEKQLGKEHPFVATTISNLAELYRAKGDYARAEPLYQSALQLREKALGQEHQDVAVSLNNLATFYVNQGKYLQAEPLYQRALAILEKILGGEHPTVATILNNLGELYGQRGDYVRASSFYLRAVQIRIKTLGPAHPDVAISVNNIALVLLQTGNIKQAEQFLQYALGIWEKSLGTDHPNVATALDNLAVLYERKGDSARAEAIYQRALAIREKVLGAEHPDVANTLTNLALLYHGKGDYARAESLQQRAITIYEKSLGPEHPQIATLLNNLAGIYSSKGETERAVQIQARAADINERHLALLLTTGSEEQKRIYASTLSNETAYTLSLHIRDLPNNVDAARLALTTLLRRKGRLLDALSDQMGALRHHLRPQDRALLEQLSTVQSQLAALILKGPGKTDSAVYQETIIKLRTQIAQLETEISQRSAEFRAQSEPITIEKIQSAIPAQTMLVEIAAYRPYKSKVQLEGDRWEPSRYVAYLLSKEGKLAWVDLGESAPIDADIARFRAALNDIESKDLKVIARSLDEKVMRPIRKLLGNTHQLFLSPDGALNLIPFAAFVDEQGRYLVENYTINYLTSGRDLLRLEAKTATESRQPPVIIANPAFDLTLTPASPPQDGGGAGRRSGELSQTRWSPLTHTAEEAIAIRTIVTDAQVFTETKATETALKQLVGPSILHIATHGFFLKDKPPVTAPALPETLGAGMHLLDSLVLGDENPLLRSGLILAGANNRLGGAGEDGILTALEASTLDLWGTKLVILSACQTGVGDIMNGEGVYGLRRALVLAGAESELMSLWRIDDEATRDLMLEYYKKLQKGEGRAEAFRQVQLWMMRRKGREHPYFWAGFIPIGNWKSLNMKSSDAR